MSYSIYINHLIGAFFVIFALGGSLLQAINTGNKNFQFKKVTSEQFTVLDYYYSSLRVLD